MPIEHIHTYLVHPGKGSATPPQIGGTAVRLEGKLFHLLSDIYAKSEHECDIDISFNRSPGGAQQNVCRDLVVAYVRGPTVVRGRQIAERLETVTTHRSGLGLLFLIAGKEGRESKIVISRFPADSGILAEEDRHALTVEFIERVFMKSAKAYKAVVYKHASLEAGFWIGRAIDRQINSGITQTSNYWIAEFLDSDFRTTAAAGTRRLAIALRDAAKKADEIAVKTEIAAAVTLAEGLRGQRLSAGDFGRRFGLSDAAIRAVALEIREPALVDERFQFDVDEFRNQVGYRSVELDSGALLTAQSGEFDRVFQKELLDPNKHEVRYSAVGKIVSEKLRKNTG